MSTATSAHSSAPVRLGALLSELTPDRLGPSITSALISAPLLVFLAASMAALVFGGDLSRFLGDTVGLVMAGSAITCLVLALLGSVPGTISAVQGMPAAIMAAMVARLVQALPAGASSEATFALVVAAISATTMLTGAALFALGALRLGNLVRFLPYPVIGGFMASTGWLLVSGSIGVMAGISPTFGTLGALAHPELLQRWVPGLALAVFMMFALRRLRGAFALPGLIIAGILVFHGVAALLGVAPAQLSANGWLLGPFPAGSLLRAPPLGAFAQVDWSLFAAQVPSVVVIAVLTAVGTLLCATGIEIMTRRDVALNQELRAAGAANILTGLAGGMPGYPAMGLSALSIQSGRASRLTGVFTAMFILLVMVAGASLAALIPKAVAGGLLMYFGLSFMKEWLWDAWSRLSRAEHAIVMLITAVSAGIGFLEGVGVGVAAAIVMFVVAYSRVDIVRSELSGAHIHSRVSRGPQQQRILREHEDRLHVLRLQGFIFFGTADHLLNQIRQRMHDPTLAHMRMVVLDFKRVTGMDSSGVASFVKMRQAMVDRGAQLVIVDAGADLRSQLRNGGLPEGDAVHFFADLDKGLEWCENGLLREAGAQSADPDLPLREQLAPLVSHPAGLDELFANLERLELAAGAHLITQGDPADALYLVESGQLTTLLEMPGDEPLRLETMHGGRIVGEMGLYLGHPRGATIVVDAPTVVYRLGQATLQRMEREQPQGAAALHQLCARVLADRVTNLMAAASVLQQ